METITTSNLLALLQILENDYGNKPVVFKINHDVEYDDYQEKDVGYISDCRRIGKISTDIDLETGEVREITILLDQ